MFLSAPERTAVLRAFVLGMPGIVSVVFLVPPPPGVPSAALAINPMILLLLAAIGGAKCAPSVGLRSSMLLSDPWDLRILAFALLIAIVAGGLIGILDHLAAPLWRPVGSGIQTLFEASNISSLSLGVLYGGLTEEIILRWGLLSIVAASLSRLMGDRTAMITALWIAAIVFSLGHLPGVLLVEQDPSLGVVIRTCGLNLIAGLLFGFAFLRLQLEAAFVAHMSFHFGVALAEWCLRVQ